MCVVSLYSTLQISTARLHAQTQLTAFSMPKAMLLITQYVSCGKGYKSKTRSIVVVMMRIDIYGFKAKVTNDGKQYIGVIPELHVHDQADSLRELESELKDAVDTAVSFMM